MNVIKAMLINQCMDMPPIGLHNHKIDSKPVKIEDLSFLIVFEVATEHDPNTRRSPAKRQTERT